MRTLQVELGDRAYPIHIGRGLAASLYEDCRRRRRTVCVVDANVARLHAERLDRLLPGATRLELPAGESSKSLDQIARLGGELLERGLGRDGLLVAVGGGVTGDVTGFLAASYMRGISFLQVPTTLLAQVDASVGGKVAVNLPGAKNSLGFFFQPEAVLADLDWLETLPAREWSSGLAELIKMAAILDPPLLADLESKGAELSSTRCEALESFVLRACDLKRTVVEEDEKEAGRRQILNFGHTVAHAIEGLAAPSPMLHGEAVAVGMLVALRLGERRGTGPARMTERLQELLEPLNLPCRLPPGATPEALVSVMARDKKRRDASHRFVLLRDWGQAEFGLEVEDALLLEVLAEFGP